MLLPVSSNFGRGNGNKEINFVEGKSTTGLRRKFSSACTEEIFAVRLHLIISITKFTRKGDIIYVIYKLVRCLGEDLEPEESRESYHQLNFLWSVFNNG